MSFLVFDCGKYWTWVGVRARVDESARCWKLVTKGFDENANTLDDYLFLRRYEISIFEKGV